MNSSEDSVKALTRIVETASTKAKEALDTQRKTAEDFEALAKRLNKAAPKDGRLDQNLSKAGREEEARKKKEALLDKDNAEQQSTFFADRISQLQALADVERKKAETDKSTRQAIYVNEAENAVRSEELYQKQVVRQQENIRIDKEAQAKVTSDLEALAIRNAAATDLKDITEQIAKNGKGGVRNEAEIQRLKDIGVLLEKNKNDASGVFNTEELAQYAKEIASISAVATKADVLATKALEDKAFEETKAKLDIISAKLAAVTFGIDDASITREADRVKAVIDEKLKSINVALKIFPEYTPKLETSERSVYDAYGTRFQKETPQKFADGGIVRGPGGSRGDKIPAWLSDGENITPAHIMQKPGMYALQDFINRGGDIADLSKVLAVMLMEAIVLLLAIVIAVFRLTYEQILAIYS